MSDQITNGLLGVSVGMLGLGFCGLLLGPVYITGFLRKDANSAEVKAYRALPIIIAVLTLIGAFGAGYFSTPAA